MVRKIRDRQDAIESLEAAAASGLPRAVWARSQGIDGRSLNCWRQNLGWGAASVETIVELVPSEPSARVGRYVLRVDGLEIELDDQFREDTLTRLLRVVASC